MSAAGFKKAVGAYIGMPLEEVLKQYQNELTAVEADSLRKLSPRDLETLRQSDKIVSDTMGESGGGCGAYY